MIILSKFFLGYKKNFIYSLIRNKNTQQIFSNIVKVISMKYLPQLQQPDLKYIRISFSS